MRTFIQLRDGVGFATLHTPDGEPDHSVTPDHTTAVEVVTDNPDQFLNMKYDEKTKSWSQAERIVYADIDESGRVTELRRTYFIHEADGKPIITSELLEELRPDWKWINGEWVKPYIEVEEVTEAIEPPTETEEERLARVEANK